MKSALAFTVLIFSLVFIDSPTYANNLNWLAYDCQLLSFNTNTSDSSKKTTWNKEKKRCEFTKPDTVFLLKINCEGQGGKVKAIRKTDQQSVDLSAYFKIYGDLRKANDDASKQKINSLQKLFSQHHIFCDQKCSNLKTHYESFLTDICSVTTSDKKAGKETCDFISTNCQLPNDENKCNLGNGFKLKEDYQICMKEENISPGARPRNSSGKSTN